jgi:uncharacterized protein YcbX
LEQIITPNVKLSRITLYPIKSLDGVEVQEATILPGGALQYDREFALFNEAGRTVNAKKYPSIHRIRVDYDLSRRLLMLSIGGFPDTFSLDDDREGIEHWFSQYFGIRVSLRQNQEMGFPDDTERSGPTLLSRQSLEEVSRWFEGEISVESLRRRFRANLEVEAGEAFAEDALFDGAEKGKSFQLGEVNFMGIKACPRCPVPSRDPETGKVLAAFSKTFTRQREAHLPDFAPKSAFPHHYMMAVNTRIAQSETGKTLKVGDSLIR